MSNITPLNRQLATTASAECSQALWQRLTTNSASFFEAADEIAGRPALRAELATVIERLERHAEPCGGKAVVATLTPLVTLYGVSDKSEGEWKAFWRFYVEALEDLPMAALKAGVSEYVADAKSEFFPKPGPLKALCDRHALPTRMALSRARKALSVPEAEAQRRIR